MKAPVGWGATVVLVALLMVLALDTEHLVHFPGWFWTTLYSMSAVALLGWRIWRWSWTLLWAGGAMFVASFCRATTFLAFTDRYSGAALNALMALATIRFMVVETEVARG